MSLTSSHSRKTFYLFMHSLLPACRRSSIACCVGLDSMHGPSTLQHCTFLDLRLPPFGLLAGTIFGNEGANHGQVEHIELTCVQDQRTGQTAVQQYRVPIELVLPPVTEGSGEVEGKVDTAVVDAECDNGDMESALSAEMLSLMNLDDHDDHDNHHGPQDHNTADTTTGNDTHSNVAPPITVAPPIESPPNQHKGEASGGSAGISFISKDPTSLPIGAFPDFALVGGDSGGGSSSVTGSAQGVSTTSADRGAKSKHILLNALKVKSTPSSDTAPVSEVRQVQKGPPSQTAKTSDPNTASKADPPKTASKTTSNVHSVTPKTSAVGVSSSTDLKRSPVTTSSFSDLASKRPLESKEGAGVLGSPQTSREGVSSLGGPDDDWEKASLTISRSQHNTPRGGAGEGQGRGGADFDRAVLMEKLNAIEQTLQSMNDKRLQEAKTAQSKEATRGIDKHIAGQMKGMLDAQGKHIVMQTVEQLRVSEEQVISAVRRASQ